MESCSLSIIAPLSYCETSFDNMIPQVACGELNANIEIIVIRDRMNANIVGESRQYSSSPVEIKVIDCDCDNFLNSMNNALSVASGEYIAFSAPNQIAAYIKSERVLHLVKSRLAEIIRIVPLDFDVPNCKVLADELVSGAPIGILDGTIFSSSILSSPLVKFDTAIGNASIKLFLAQLLLRARTLTYIKDECFMPELHQWLWCRASSEEDIAFASQGMQLIIDSYQTKGRFHDAKPMLLNTACSILANVLSINKTVLSYDALSEDWVDLLSTYFGDEWSSVLKNQIKNCGSTWKGKSFRSRFLKKRCLRSDLGPGRSSDNKKLFSVVIPVYNVEQYLYETVQSLVDQSIGFDKIQVILVNDGSTDGSLGVCNELLALYPDNVVVVSQPNSGVSVARNAGLALAEGKYINFLDSDDKWSKDAFIEAACFFDNHPDISLVSTKLKYFGARKGDHPLNFKYQRTRVIDPAWQPAYIQLSLPSCFVRSEALRGLKFDERLTVSEDMLFVNEILLRTRCYGVLKNAVYKYRKRDDASSAIDTSQSNEGFYFDTPMLCYQKLLDMFAKTSLQQYSQYLIMYDLQWRIKAKDAGFLDGKAKKRYLAIIKGLLAHIPDEVIIDQKNMTSEFKGYALALKYGMQFEEVVNHRDDYMAIFGDWCRRFPGRIAFDFISMAPDGHIRFEGEVFALKAGLNFSLGAVIQYQENATSTVYATNVYRRRKSERDSFFEKGFFCPNAFVLECPIGEGIKNVSFFVEFDNRTVDIEVLQFRKFVRLSNRLSYSLFEENGVQAISDNGSLSFYRCGTFRAFGRKMAFFSEILRSKNGLKSFAYAALSNVIHAISKRQIWLISDRIVAAGDNGEALFEYLCAQTKGSIEPYFVISSQVDDYSRLKKIGHVVAYGSLRYKILFLMSERIVSSAADEYVINAFGKNRDVMKCFYRFKYVFLQHGITKDDQTKWLNRFNKNISLLVSAAKPEYQAFVGNREYYYTDSQVKLLGFPRHDKLLKHDVGQERLILFMPTWRQGLAGPFDKESGKRRQNDSFQMSDYFKFYNGLLNDVQFIEILQAFGYRAKFVIHPALIQESIKFDRNTLVDIPTAPQNYSQEFKKASILVTDYSSVAFDFAMLKKPIIYAQFDENTFFGGHLYDRGYFDYRRDGFGPVCRTIDETIKAIEQCLANNCKEEVVYKNRIECFFGAQPSSRCSRVADAIKDL